MPEHRGAKIMIVDDDPGVVRSAGLYLQRSGYRVIEAYSGEQGLELLKSTVPDLIVLDIEMSPGISGPEFLASTRRNLSTGCIPVVFLTARVDLDAMEATLEDEAQGYLLKPLSGGALLDKIEEVLDSRDELPSGEE